MTTDHQVQLTQDAAPVFPSEPPHGVESTAIHPQLEDVEAETPRLAIASVTVIAGQACVTPSIHEYCTVLAPCAKLPTELISAIIPLCVSPQLCFPLEHGKNDPHLQITQICSSWRIVAFSLASLWNSTFYRDFILESSIELVKSLLSHDRTTLVSIAIHGKPPPTFRNALHKDADILEIDEVVVELVVPNSQRLKSLDLILEGSDWDTIRPLNFENLASLRLLIEDTAEPDKSGPPLHAPLLQSVSVHANWMQEQILDLLPGVPWTQLLRLSLSGRQSIADIFSVLTQCTSLEVFTLHPFIPDYEFLTYSFQSIAPLALPRLRHLSFYFTTPMTGQLLPLLRLPRLWSAAFGGTFPFKEFLLSFAAFIDSVKNTLEVLEIMGNDGVFSMDEDIFSAVSPVKYLLLPLGYTFSQSALSRVCSGDILPNIQYLELAITGTEDDAHKVSWMRYWREAHTVCAPILHRILWRVSGRWPSTAMTFP